MGFLSISILILTIAFLVHQYPSMLEGFLPAWLVSGNAQTREENTRNVSQQNDEDEITEGETTPKAKAQPISDDVPTFTLSDNIPEDEKTSEEPGVSSFPTASSAQRASSLPPPPVPKFNTNGASGLMPPPTSSTPLPKRSAAAGLRVPSTGPLPSRGPPTGSQQRVASNLTASGTAKTSPDPRNKVLLKPGHSPMDWAALTKKGNISGVATFQRVTPSHLKTMTGRKGKPAWSSWQGKVYNITPYLPFHPGGEAELMKAAGRDGSKLFMEVHPWVNWENMLGTCLVGILVPETNGQVDGGTLEDMD